MTSPHDDIFRFLLEIVAPYGNQIGVHFYCRKVNFSCFVKKGGEKLVWFPERESLIYAQERLMLPLVRDF